MPDTAAAKRTLVEAKPAAALERFFSAVTVSETFEKVIMTGFAPQVHCAPERLNSLQSFVAPSC
jgi:hypothetical protein